MVRYFGAAATATVLDHSLRRSRDHIGFEIICVTGFASGDGTGLVSRSTTSSAVVGEPGYAQRDASHVVEAGARRSARAHTGSPPKQIIPVCGPASVERRPLLYTGQMNSLFVGVLDFWLIHFGCLMRIRPLPDKSYKSYGL
jgi:hypothetical protein